MSDDTYKTDPERPDLCTGFYIRADIGNRFRSVDISQLDTHSLRLWLQSRGGSNPWAERILAVLLRHKGEDIEREWPE